MDAEILTMSEDEFIELALRRRAEALARVASRDGPGNLETFTYRGPQQ